LDVLVPRPGGLGDERPAPCTGQEGDVRRQAPNTSKLNIKILDYIDCITSIGLHLVVARPPLPQHSAIAPAAEHLQLPLEHSPAP